MTSKEDTVTQDTVDQNQVPMSAQQPGHKKSVVPGTYLSFYTLNDKRLLKSYHQVDVILDEQPQRRASLFVSPDKTIQAEKYYRVKQTKGYKYQSSSDSEIPCITLYPECKVLDSDEFVVDEDLKKGFFDAPQCSISNAKLSPMKRTRCSVTGVIRNKRKFDQRVEIELEEQDKSSSIMTKFWTKDMCKVIPCEEGEQYSIKNLETSKYLDGPIYLSGTPETLVEPISGKKEIQGKLTAAERDAKEDLMLLNIDSEEFYILKKRWSEGFVVGKSYKFQVAGNIVEEIKEIEDVASKKLKVS